MTCVFQGCKLYNQELEFAEKERKLERKPEAEHAGAAELPGGGNSKSSYQERRNVSRGRAFEEAPGMVRPGRFDLRRETTAYAPTAMSMPTNRR